LISKIHFRREGETKAPVTEDVAFKATTTDEGTEAIHISIYPEVKETTCAELGEQIVEEQSAHVTNLDANTQVPSDENATCFRRKHQSSCPPKATQSVNSGLWSLEWIQDQVHGDVGVVSSSKNKVRNKSGDDTKSSKGGMMGTSTNKIKSRAKIQHLTYNLKIIARLPSQDRKQVLQLLSRKVLKQKESKRSNELADVITKGSQVSDSSSSVSINNELEALCGFAWQ